MVHYKSLFVALAAVSIVAASPCKPSTTSAGLSTTATVLEEPTSTQTSAIEETTTATVDETTAAATTTASIEAALTTTTVAADTTTTAAPSGVCGITGYFLPNQALNYLNSPGKKDNIRQCLEACAAYAGCEVVAFYTDRSFVTDIGRCEFFSGELVTDRQDTSYEWSEVGCLDNLQD
ncbi:hypothetical protein RAB80_007240 [Fusarium oxysporum f. sp. vasinfectum]|uniref:Apple domain-containing protein n=1 Tax=Fusarium oxysporum f. sp. vasinfectum 25433 TaxID=1089449 RepID=X0L8G6_FUSOX|nr:hypothetical protein FOTG_14425 [Fusarium oxysporum f. sp. vasinfectum 25433]KAK2678500.1 hypothetical protein RAB80_007240 [Fusarium oxysporum f. sp. vasinfectum]KAK2923712.1 hypothetical protein FoTM2_015869 [Fusarium oxysporum f. sp. vasinfectum]